MFLFSDHAFGRAVLALFTVFCALEDLKTGSVPACFFRAVLLLELIWYLILPGTLREAASAGELSSLCSGLFAGIGLYLLSCLSGEQLGKGDSLFFLAYGVGCGGKALALLLVFTFFPAGLFSLILLSLSGFPGGKLRRRQFPLLPFAALPALLYLAGRQGIGF